MTATSSASDGPLFCAVKVYLAASPGTKVLGSACLVMATSALVSMLVMALALLLPGTGSSVVVFTNAEFVMVPGPVEGLTRTTMVMVWVSPGTIVPKLQSTVVVSWKQAGTGVNDTRVVPTGAASDTVTFSASEGPLFVATSV